MTNTEANNTISSVEKQGAIDRAHAAAVAEYVTSILLLAGPHAVITGALGIWGIVRGTQNMYKASEINKGTYTPSRGIISRLRRP